MGRNRGNLPTQDKSKELVNDNGHQLAPQLGHRLLHAVSGEFRSRQRQSSEQDLLHLVRLLLLVHHIRVFYDLRDQGLDVGAG